MASVRFISRMISLTIPTEATMNERKVDCGCLIFHYLTIPEAIAFSRISHFWYDLSSRRAAYRPMKFPSFQEEFDILEYRHWQEYGRQQLAVTSNQLIQFSTSRVIQYGLHDLELIVDSSPFDSIHSDLSQWRGYCSSMESMESRFSNVILLLHSIQALTITIAPNLEPKQTSRLSVDYVAIHQELQRIFVTRLLTHLAPQLISLQILPPRGPSQGLNFAHSLVVEAVHSNLTMPSLLHAIVPVMADDDLEDVWRVRWESLGPFQPRVLELSAILWWNGHRPVLVPYWSTVNKCPEKLIHLPNLILNNQHYYQALAGHSTTNRSVCLQVHTNAHDPLGTIEHYVSERIPVDANYQEVDVTLLHADDLPASVFTPLRRVAHSLRILNLEVDGYMDEDYQVLLSRLCTAAGIEQSDQVDYTSDSESPFTHVTRVRINYHGDQNSYPTPSIDISLLPRIYPNLDDLELASSFIISFDSLVHTFPYHQLRHLTTTLPLSHYWGDQHSREYMMHIVTKLRQLESLHLILDFSDPIIKQDSHFILLVLSSPNLAQVVFSSSSGGPERSWLTFFPSRLDDLNDWLIQLHLIWRMIQPTHPLPIDQIALTSITRVIDILPLLGTFLRHPIHRLPHLRHRCHQYDPHPPSTNWIKQFATKLTSLITPHLTSWFQRDITSEAAALRMKQAEELALKQQRLKLVAHLSARSQALLRRLDETRAQCPSITSALHHLKIEPRTHFRMVIQEQDLLHY